MTDLDESLALLRKHVAEIEISEFPAFARAIPARNRFNPIARIALGAALVGVPALGFAAMSYYAGDNADAIKLAHALSHATGHQVQADQVVSDRSTDAERAFASHGFRVVRSATYRSGSKSVEIATDHGNAIVIVGHDTKHLILEPTGGSTGFYHWRNVAYRRGGYDAGYDVMSKGEKHWITITTQQILPEAEFQAIVEAARSEAP